MIYIQPSSFKVANPQQKTERIKNDLKYSWAMGSVGGLGAAATIAGYQRPDLYVNGYNNAAKFVSTQMQNAKNSEAGKAVIKKAKEVNVFLYKQLKKLKSTDLYKQIQTKIGPGLKNLKTKFSGLKQGVSELAGNVSKWLSKIPTNYKIAGAAAAVTLALLCKLSNQHAYNEGKIDGRYEK